MAYMYLQSNSHYDATDDASMYAIHTHRKCYTSGIDFFYGLVDAVQLTLEIVNIKYATLSTPIAEQKLRYSAYICLGGGGGDTPG